MSDAFQTPRRLNATAAALRALVERVTAGALERTQPYVVAIDGRSGVGKSTFAGLLTDALDAALVDGDGFYAGGTGLRIDGAASRAQACIDWRRLGTVIENLRAGRTASYRPFDWEAFDGSLAPDEVQVQPRQIVIVEGVYAARPELAALLDLRVLLCVPEPDRVKRLMAREVEIGPWERQWHEAEDYYFSSVMPPAAFDMVVDTR